METSALLDSLVATVTVTTATLATEPPVEASMVSLGAMRGNTNPRRALLSLKGSTATPRTLTNGKVWGWDSRLGTSTLIGFVLDGVTVTISTTQSAAQLLDDVIACYTHVGVTGTLAGDSVAISVIPLEVLGD